LKRADWGGDFLKRQNEQMSSVWAIHAPGILERKFGKHPTQKPQELLKRIVLSCTKKGDMVLDPFCGSGTTGLASYKYRRGFVGIESDKVFLDLTISRFGELEKNLISAPRDETMSPPTVVSKHE
jgi:site-specific DNA-methyltransferase (adenine-specific)